MMPAAGEAWADGLETVSETPRVHGCLGSNTIFMKPDIQGTGYWHI